MVRSMLSQGAVLVEPGSEPVPASAPPDPERVDAFVRRHHAFVWRVLRRNGLAPADADDAAQKVFLVTIARLSGIHAGSERAFLYRTAAHVASKAQRAVRRRPDTAAIGDREETDQEPLPDALLDQRRARQLLDRILGEIPDDLRSALILFDLEGLTKQEVAEALGIPPGTVASRVRRAREEVEARVLRHQARLRSKGAPP
jgi:RNA polymerase sigma-70 factor (ECF subfamily)